MDKKEMRGTAAEAIIEASKFAAMMGVNATDLGIEISASFFLNLRDAMFHFKALCDYEDAGNNEKAIQNYYEHRVGKRNFRIEQRSYLMILKGFSSSTPFFYDALRERFHSNPIKGGGLSYSCYNA